MTVKDHSRKFIKPEYPIVKIGVTLIQNTGSVGCVKGKRRVNSCTMHALNVLNTLIMKINTVTSIVWDVSIDQKWQSAIKI